ncbi:transposable element Tcb1 transposase [Trichonephila clavipes]|nr:transposable element Tcb1 transposase [Trichonephila clavipes]
MKLSLLTTHACLQHYDVRIRVWRHHGERMHCVMYSLTGPAPGIMIWGGIGYHSRTLVRVAGTLNSKRYISEIQRLTEITPLSASPDQLWQRVEAVWSAVTQETSKVSLNQCRGVWLR